MTSKNLNYDGLPKEVPALFNHIYDQICDIGKKRGLKEADAKQIAKETCYKMAEDFGGELIYIPKALCFAATERDLKIYAEFDGTNHRELAHKYKLAMATVYQIVKRVHKQEVNRRQLAMFD